MDKIQQLHNEHIDMMNTCDSIERKIENLKILCVGTSIVLFVVFVITFNLFINRMEQSVDSFVERTDRRTEQLLRSLDQDDRRPE
jgi:predicted PurR-regulated permease PerM